MTTPHDPMMPDPDMQAAELALGLLDGEERAAALRRLLAEPDFAAEVETWRAHFAQMIDGYAEAAPPADGLARLEAALAPPAAAAPPAPIAANDTAPVRRWQALAGISSLAAALMLGVVLLRPAPPVPAPVIVAAKPVPVLVAAIVPSGKGAPIAAIYDPDSGALRVAPAALVDAAHSAELWVIGADQVPVSLGLMQAARTTRVGIAAPVRVQFAPGATIAITAEAPGGSPTGKPQGPIVAAGTLARI
ncbi:anti-sigma factor [Sphingomonas sp.]|uniref:anti-sigma factor n=1 Tax=Sphingomonas sp. TaxID=28214 RepID=UPI001D94A7B8|nr:anti-sigma factor [Sphingomonas sp.]MBX9795483.1 anti-sigma factor [Sphingomonas sp.]